MCTILADTRRTRDVVPWHPLCGDTSVRGRKVILHHQSAGTPECKCKFHTLTTENHILAHIVLSDVFSCRFKLQLCASAILIFCTVLVYSVFCFLLLLLLIYPLRRGRRERSITFIIPHGLTLASQNPQPASWISCLRCGNLAHSGWFTVQQWSTAVQESADRERSLWSTLVSFWWVGLLKLFQKRFNSYQSNFQFCYGL